MLSISVLFFPDHIYTFSIPDALKSIELLSSTTIRRASDFFHTQPSRFFFRHRQEKISRNCTTFTPPTNHEVFFAMQNFLIARLTPMAEARGGHPICANGFSSNARARLSFLALSRVDLFCRDSFVT